ncbi:MAG: EamA family transporter [Bacteroidota bacterium]
MESERFKIASGYALICLIWGSTWLAIRIGLESLTPVISGGLRFLLASLFVFILMKFKKIKLQTDQHSVRLYLILALFSFSIPFGLVYWAEQFIPSGLASILFAVFPFYVIIFSKIAMPESEVTSAQIFGVIIGFAGILIIFAEDLKFDFSNDLLGMLAVLVSSGIQGAIAVMIKKHGGHLNPLSMNFIPLLIAGILMIITSLLIENKSTWVFDIRAVGSIFYLALFGTVVTFTTYYWLLKRINVVILSISTLITPMVAVFLGWIILGEHFSLQDLIGSGLVLIGILFANFKGIINYYKLKNTVT